MEAEAGVAVFENRLGGRRGGRHRGRPLLLASLLLLPHQLIVEGLRDGLHCVLLLFLVLLFLLLVILLLKEEFFKSVAWF